MRPGLAWMLAVGVVAPGSDAADDPGRPAIGTTVEGLTFQDIRFLTRGLDDFGERRAFVVVATSTTCPLADRYLPVLGAMEREYRGRGVQFLALNVGVGDSILDMAAQAVESEVDFPFVKDRDGSCTRRLGLTRTPEVAVLDAGRRLRYRGRVDDRYRLGGVRPSRGREDLREAIEAILAGEEPRTPETPVDGCLIAGPPAEEPGDPPNYAEHVAPILRRHCQGCHRPGAEAPFALTTYRDAAAQGATLAEAVADRRMPPWYAAAGRGRFLNHRGLDDDERETIARWFRAGMPRGDLGRAPEPLGPVEGRWTIGEPDLVISMPLAHAVPASGDVPYRYVVLPHVFLHDTWVQAIEILPDNPRVVHHANLGFARLGEPVRGENFLTGRVPGGEALRLDDGMAALIPKGSVLGLQIHYVATGRPERVRISVGLRFPRSIVRKRLYHTQVYTNRFAIPPHEPAHRVAARRTLDFDATGVGLFAHMHLRGRDATFFAHRPDGTTETLLLIPNYSFDWQQPYHFEPGRARFPEGTVFEVVAHFDNSAFNPFNPDPDATVRHGDQTHEEMMYGFYFYTRDDENLGLSVDPTTGRVVE